MKHDQHDTVEPVLPDEETIGMADYDTSIHHNPDAQAWTKFYCETFPDADEGLMHGWFANAMMAMHDHLMQKHEWTDGWQDIATAPRDGTSIQAEIPGNGSDNVIAWQTDAFMSDLGEPCGGWAFTTDQEPPDCWTDGVCWAFNEDGNPSAQPTRWKPLPPTNGGQGE